MSLSVGLRVYDRDIWVGLASAKPLGPIAFIYCGLREGGSSALERS